MREQPKTRVEIEFMDDDGGLKGSLQNTRETIILQLNPQQEAFLRARLERIGKSEDDEKGSPGKLLRITLNLIMNDFKGEGFSVAYGKTVHVPTICKAVVEVFDGQATAEDAFMALSP